VGDYAFEVKWDGFRAIVSTEGALRVRSRRGWNMTGNDGRPDFPLVCDCVLHRQSSIPLVFVVFDVLRVEGRDVTREPYSERRRILTQMRLNGPRWRTPEAFEDGAPLWYAVCEHEREGAMLSRHRSPAQL
jgi:bifunctional non-homologous end joining protein LigD